jgi:hypothetical protein
MALVDVDVRDTPPRFSSSSMMSWCIGSAFSPYGSGQCGTM